MLRFHCGFNLSYSVNLISLIGIAGVYAFHIDLPIIDLVRQRGLQQHLDFQVLHWAALHGQQIVLLVHMAPIHNLFQLFLQDRVQPKPGTPAVALPKRVGNIHLNILFDDLIIGRLRHLPDASQCVLEVQHRCKTETTLGEVDGPNLSGKVIDILEKIPVNLRQTRKGPDFKRIQQALFKQLQSPLFAETFLCSGQFR